MCIGHPHAAVCRQRSGSNSLSRALFSLLYVASRHPIHFQACAANTFPCCAFSPAQSRRHVKQTFLTDGSEWGCTWQTLGSSDPVD